MSSASVRLCSRTLGLLRSRRGPLSAGLGRLHVLRPSPAVRTPPRPQRCWAAAARSRASLTSTTSATATGGSAGTRRATTTAAATATPPDSNPTMSGIDFKSSLNTLCAKSRLSQPQYAFESFGPQHSPRFNAMCTIRTGAGAMEVRGVGTNKKLAGQESARVMLTALEQQGYRVEGPARHHLHSAAQGGGYPPTAAMGQGYYPGSHGHGQSSYYPPQGHYDSSVPGGAAMAATDPQARQPLPGERPWKRARQVSPSGAAAPLSAAAYAHPMSTGYDGRGGYDQMHGHHNSARMSRPEPSWDCSADGYEIVPFQNLTFKDPKQALNFHVQLAKGQVRYLYRHVSQGFVARALIDHPRRLAFEGGLERVKKRAETSAAAQACAELQRHNDLLKPSAHQTRDEFRQPIPFRIAAPLQARLQQALDACRAEAEPETRKKSRWGPRTDATDVHQAKKPMDATLFKRLSQEQRAERRAAEGTKQFIVMKAGRDRLPVFKEKETILKTIRESKSVILSGETGSGKTTQVPQYILDEAIDADEAAGCNVIVTQPRLISAVSIAERVADERCERIGASVGYQVRLQSVRPSSPGSISYVTTGILLRMFQSDNDLTGISHVVVDEAHERSLDIDFLLVLLKGLLTRRHDLKVIIMSATLNSDMFQKYFDGAAAITVPGFMFPVKSIFLDDLRNVRRHLPPSRHELTSPQESLDVAMWTDALAHAVQAFPTGSILCFMAGLGDIKKLAQEMSMHYIFRDYRAYQVLPLHSSLSADEQRRVFQPVPDHCRKIILATNIAETSITIDDVTVVVEGGNMKENSVNSVTGSSTLSKEWVSKANVRQRQGRAGRVQSGTCLHLYYKAEHAMMRDFPVPEILRVSLEKLVLQILLLYPEKTPEEFLKGAIESPELLAIRAANQRLLRLGAIRRDGDSGRVALTELGEHLARLPMDPSQGKLLIYSSMVGCLDAALTLTASMAEGKGIFVSPLERREEAQHARRSFARKEQSDAVSMINAYREWDYVRSQEDPYRFCRSSFLSFNGLRRAEGIRTQLARYLKENGFIRSRDDVDAVPMSEKEQLRERALLSSVLVASLFPSVAKIVSSNKGKTKQALITTHDTQVRLHPSSVLPRDVPIDGRFLTFFQEVHTSEKFVREVTVVPTLAVLCFAGASLNIMYTDRSRDLMTLGIDRDEAMQFECASQTGALLVHTREVLGALISRYLQTPSKPLRECDEQLLDAIVEVLQQPESKDPWR